MSDNTFNGGMRGIPPQKLLDKLKTKPWVIANFEAYENMVSYSGNNGRTTKYDKQTNYDILNSIFSKEDFVHVTNPYGFTEDVGGQPAILQNHNIIRAKIELLRGEEAKLPFKWNVVGSYGEVIREKDERQRQQLTEVLQQILTAKMEGREEQAPDLAAVQQYFRTKYVDVREKNASHILRQTWERQDLRDKFNDGWEHALAVAEEIYYVGKTKGRPIVRVVNPMNVEFDKDPDLRQIQKGNWFREERIMSVGNILDTYGEFLEDADVKKLDEGAGGFGLGRLWNMWNTSHVPGAAPNLDMQPGAQIPNFGVNVPEVWEPSQNHRKQGDENGNQGVPVITLVWRSMRRLDYLNFEDENGPQTQLVEQGFKLTKEQKDSGAYIDTEWITDIWKCTRIGEDIYVDYGPLENQTGDLPYIGYIYNNTNSRATSLVDLVKPHQYTYMVVMYKLMLEVAKYKGSKFAFDLAQFPANGIHGMSMDKWLYYMDTVGIITFNSLEEGTPGDSGSRSSFNQFHVLNPDPLNVVTVLISLLDKIEAMVGDVLGVSRQREGNTATSETVGGIERSVIQSSAITARLFMQHNAVKRAVLQQVLEIGKLCLLEDNEVTQLMVDDAYRELIKIDAEQLNDSEYDVRVSDSIEIAMIKEKLEHLVEIALQSDKARLTDAIKIIQSQSISEIASTIKEGEEAKYERDAEASKAQQEQAQAQMASEEKKFMEDLNYKINKDALDRQNKLDVAAVSALRGKDGPSDMNQDGVPDPLQAAEVYHKQAQLEHQKQMDNLKLSNEVAKSQMDAHDRATKNQLAMEKLKTDTAKMEAEVEKAKIELLLRKEENAQQDQHKAIEVQEKEKDRKLEMYKIERQAKLDKEKADMDAKLKQKESEQKMKLERFKIKNKPKPKGPSKKK